MKRIANIIYSNLNKEADIPVFALEKLESMDAKDFLFMRKRSSIKKAIERVKREEKKRFLFETEDVFIAIFVNIGKFRHMRIIEKKSGDVLDKLIDYFVGLPEFLNGWVADSEYEQLQNLMFPTGQDLENMKKAKTPYAFVPNRPYETVDLSKNPSRIGLGVNYLEGVGQTMWVSEVFINTDDLVLPCESVLSKVKDFDKKVFKITTGNEIFTDDTPADLMNNLRSSVYGAACRQLKKQSNDKPLNEKERFALPRKCDVGISENDIRENSKKIDTNAAVETVMVFDTRLSDGELDRELCFQALGVAGPSWGKATRDLNSETAETWLGTHFKNMNEAPNPAPKGKPFATVSVIFSAAMPDEIAKELLARINRVGRDNGVSLGMLAGQMPLDAEDKLKGRAKVYHFIPGRPRPTPVA